MPPVHVALITAYNSKGELLLGKRNDNGRFTLPAGHIEPKESPEEGAHRELTEETGLETGSLSPLTVITLPNGTVLHCFSAFVSGDPHGANDPDAECDEWKFVDISEGLPPAIANKLHGPQDVDHNLLLRLFKVKKADHELMKSLRFKAAFRHPTTGQIVPSGSFHDIGNLPEETAHEYESGFMDESGRFYSREEAAKAVRPQAAPRALDSSDLAGDFRTTGDTFRPIGKDFGKSEADDEIARLLKNPDPIERAMALKLNGIQPHHLDTAARDPHVGVHTAAIYHPDFDDAAAMRLLSSDGAVEQKKAFLNHSKTSVRPEHLLAFYHSPGVSKEDALEELVRHPKLSIEMARDLWFNPDLSLEQRKQLLRNPATPPDVHHGVLETASLVPGEPVALAKESISSDSCHPADLERLVQRATGSNKPHLHELAAHALSTCVFPHRFLHQILAASRSYDDDLHNELRSALVSGPSAAPDHLHEVLNGRNWQSAATSPRLQPDHIDTILDRLLAEPGRNEEALSKLMDHPSFGRQHLAKLIQPLQKGEALAKAINPSHLSSIAKATDKAGKDHVDHVPHLSAHPMGIDPEVKAYREQVLDSPKPVGKVGKTAAGVSEGITRKAVFKAKVGQNEEPTKFMVKPYHERVIQRVKWYMKNPIQGWAEMTHQGLYHAAGIGHLHQKVHVAEHNMGPGHEKEPGLVIHMSPGHMPIYDGGREAYKPELHGPDVRKIALMDFLTNNRDRHSGNLLMPPLAIDHSRSFQYVLPRAADDDYHKKGGDDYFGAYVKHSAIGGLDSIIPRDVPSSERYDHEMKALENYTPTFEWWGTVSQKVRDEFSKHLQQIKNPDVRDHLKRNFEARADWLDERAKLGLENYGTDWHRDEVPHYYPGQLTDDEKEDPKYMEQYNARRQAEREVKRAAAAQKRAARQSPEPGRKVA